MRSDKKSKPQNSTGDNSCKAAISAFASKYWQHDEPDTTVILFGQFLGQLLSDVKSNGGKAENEFDDDAGVIVNLDNETRCQERPHRNRTLLLRLSPTNHLCSSSNQICSTQQQAVMGN